MVTPIDLAASRTVIGGVSGEERPPIDNLLHGRGRRREAVAAERRCRKGSRDLRSLAEATPAAATASSVAAAVCTAGL